MFAKPGADAPARRRSAPNRFWRNRPVIGNRPRWRLLSDLEAARQFAEEFLSGPALQQLLEADANHRRRNRRQRLDAPQRRVHVLLQRAVREDHDVDLVLAFARLLL